MNISLSKGTITAKIDGSLLDKTGEYFNKKGSIFVLVLLTLVSIWAFLFFYFNGLGVAYNDARSHLDIGRRVVEGLKPGAAQLGSVWLPLLHILMIPTIWNDFMWHSGLAGALPSMVSYVFTGILIYRLLHQLNVGFLGRAIGVLIFAVNLNILYLQSIAMTELLLLATMTAGVYELFLWHENSRLFHLIKSAFWIMLASLVRYDAWFLFVFALGLIIYNVYPKKGFKVTEGVVIFFSTLGAWGIVLWFIWNLLIFKDPLYFVFGPFSAHSQQKLLEGAGSLITKGNLGLSTRYYLSALVYNQGAFTAILGFLGLIVLMFDQAIQKSVRTSTLALLAPLFFNIIALYLGHSVLHIQGLSGNTWFNVRYGIMMVPSVAIYIGFLVDRLKSLRGVLVGLLAFVVLVSIARFDAVTIDDATHGASQKNVSEVSGWLRNNSKNKKGFILISAASHDAIIFSSGLPMKKFIHEGTGEFWQKAIRNPSEFARWIIMRSEDKTDLTYKAMVQTPDFQKYRLVKEYHFAEIYELKDEYLSGLKL
jgi:hypothetical protein